MIRFELFNIIAGLDYCLNYKIIYYKKPIFIYFFRILFFSDKIIIYSITFIVGCLFTSVSNFYLYIKKRTNQNNLFPLMANSKALKFKNSFAVKSNILFPYGRLFNYHFHLNGRNVKSREILHVVQKPLSFL